MQKDKKLIIVGAGFIGEVAYEYFVYDSPYKVVAFAADREFIKENKFHGLPVIALDELNTLFSPKEYWAFIAMGNGQLNRERTDVFNRVKSIGYKIASYISSRAFVWHNVKIGENCFILEDNTLQPFTQIGNNVTMWSGNHLGHHSSIDDNCFITSHVVISGKCKIGKNCFIGVNASIADNVKIAQDNLIGLGTVINKNTHENAIYTGNPAVASKVTAKNFFSVKEEE